MRFNKILILLICFTLIVPIFSGVASAENEYNHAELLEYEGYGEAIYESIVEQTSFITGQFTENEEFVEKSIDEIIDYANFWKDEFEEWDKSCNGLSTFKDCMRDMLEKGTGYALTVGDFFKNLFSDYEEESTPSINYDYYNQFVTLETGTTDRFKVNDGYEFVVGDVVINSSDYHNYDVGGSYGQTGGVVVTANVRVTAGYDVLAPRKEFTEQADKDYLYNYEINGDFGSLIYVLNKYFDVFPYFRKADTKEKVEPEIPISQAQPIADYIRNNDVNVITPQLKAKLVCSNGQTIDLLVSGSTFLTLDGTVVDINRDGTAYFDTMDCYLDWEKPEVVYIDGKASVTDSDGNFIEIETGKIKVCLDEDGCEFESIDPSLLDYLKNAYEYAIDAIKTAVDGLNTILAGSAGLIALYGHIFGWLPNEVTVILTSGLLLMVGLRVFRK